MTYEYTPTHFNGVTLTTAPYRKVWFRAANSPVDMPRRVSQVEADVVGLGPQDVRAQPQGQTFELHVDLDGSTEAKYQTFKRDFSPNLGLVFLRADDNDAGGVVNWRLSCRVLGVRREPRSLTYFVVILRAADPVWEENGATTTTGNFSNMSGDSANVSVTPNGNEPGRPQFTISADTIKTADPAQDFTIMVRGYFVNRAPFPWTNLPLAVSDRFRADAKIDTATLRDDNTDTNDVLTTHGSGDTSITIDTPAGAGLPTGAGFAYHPASGEQLYYAGNDGSTLTGCIRGIAGTTAAVLSNNTKLDKSSILYDGSDIRVFVNGEEVERWLADFGTANTRVWINVSMPAGVRLTPSENMTAAFPADGGELQVVEGVHGLPRTGILAAQRSGGNESELTYYSDLDEAAGKFTGIERRVWYPGGPFDMTGDPVFANVQLFVLAMGRGVGSKFANGLDHPPEPADRRPAIQLNGEGNSKASTNKVWRWGDTADGDSNTIFFDAAKPNRTGQFTPDFTVGDDMKARPLLSFVTGAAVSTLSFNDDPPVESETELERVRLYLPQGIKAAASAITYDVTSGDTIRVRLLGRPSLGQEIELVDHYQIGSSTSTGQTIQPLQPLHYLTCHMVRACIMGSNNATGTRTVAFGGNSAYQLFTLAQDSFVSEFNVRIKKASSPDGTLNMYLVDADSTSDPTSSHRMIKFDNHPSFAGLTGSFVNFSVKHTSGNLFLKAGSYWFEMENSGGSQGTLDVQIGLALLSTSLGHMYEGSLRAEAMWFRVVHPHGGPVQADATVLDENNGGLLNKLIIVLNDASGEEATPMVDRELETATITTYHVTAVISNDQNSDKITLDAFMAQVDGSLVVNVADGSVVYKEATMSLAVLGAIDPNDPTSWFALDPGVANVVTWAEQDMQNTDVAMAWRSKKL